MPSIISIEGNIGAGKSTLLKRLSDFFGQLMTSVQEPVDVWGPWLTKFYSDKKRYSFSFQSRVLLSQIKLLDRSFTSPLVLTERSPMTGIGVFGKMLLDSGDMEDIEYELLKELNSCKGWFPDHVIYLRTDPQVALERIKKRSRSCESDIPLSYLEDLDKYHIELFNNMKVHYIDANRDEQEVFEDVKNILLRVLLIDEERINTNGIDVGCWGMRWNAVA